MGSSRGIPPYFNPYPNVNHAKSIAITAGVVLGVLFALKLAKSDKSPALLKKAANFVS